MQNLHRGSTEVKVVRVVMILRGTIQSMIVLGTMLGSKVGKPKSRKTLKGMMRDVGVLTEMAVRVDAAGAEAGAVKGGTGDLTVKGRTLVETGVREAAVAGAGAGAGVGAGGGAGASTSLSRSRSVSPTSFCEDEGSMANAI